MPLRSIVAVALLGAASLWAPAIGAQLLPAGLGDADPVKRQETIEKLAAEKAVFAAGKIGAMARHDPHPEVRKAACGALAALGTVEKVSLLEEIAAQDPNAEVRVAAEKAARQLKGEPKAPAPAQPVLLPAEQTAPPAGQEELSDDAEGYKRPELLVEELEAEPRTRHIALGFGTMGGYGIAAMDVRGRIPTGNAYLPWVGLEVGGGWTPPDGYQITAGPVGDVNRAPERWRIISAGGSVLLYFHRNHYVPARVGWDIGRSVYAILGYGFEHLNFEGFFSWGVELGILVQPLLEKNVEKVVDCDKTECKLDEIWPVIPFARFSLHFYLA